MSYRDEVMALEYPVSLLYVRGFRIAQERSADIAARADARIAELEREIERLDAQWRDELRIYRESGDARIAELEAALRRVRRWCMGSGYSASVQVAMKEWIDGGMVGGMPELTGLDSTIDAARANGGAS